ncbi:alkaline phosphatase family protein [Spongisporangium articulatum]|uniref:Alkaline phosphatase family protein n=1 Tax=Spongisporangium articulatum TaxID=3362603 RepID=A0ABW8APQ6_9ACTN
MADIVTPVVEALTAPDLAGVVDLVAHPDPHGAPGEAVIVAHATGRVRLTLDADGTERHEVLAGRDPVADTDPLAFLPYDLEQIDPSPANATNAYPEPARRLLGFFSDPDRSPDLAIVHTPGHYFPEYGGHRGEHGSLDVIQSRAPFILSGAGVPRRGVVDGYAHVVDVTPTLLRAAGVDERFHADAAGEPLDGRARTDLLEAGAGRYVIGILWDGGHCSDLLHLAAQGTLPNVARLIEHGTALRGGAVAEFPSVTLCNHTSALTGVGPGRHGVLGNVFYDRAQRRRILANDETTWHRSAEWFRPSVATVFEMLTRADPDATSACVDEAIDRGATASTMQLIRAAGGNDGGGALDAALPPAEDSPYLGNRAHLADSYYRFCSRVDDIGVLQMQQHWASAAVAPRLTWWSNIVTDAGHHAGGPRSAIARDSLMDADRRLGALFDHLDALGVTEDVTFLMTADHGFETADPRVRGDWKGRLDDVSARLGVGFRDEGPGLVYLDV